MKLSILSVYALLVMVALSVIAYAEDFSAAQKIIQDNVPCDQLTEDQLETLGDYYMEQMHPGDAHQQMEQAMGGEGSENLRQMHIKMARAFYCEDSSMMSAGMMGKGMMDSGMMRSGMMQQGMMGKSMMEGRYGDGGHDRFEGKLLAVFPALVALLLAGLVVVVWLHAYKLWHDLTGRRR